MPADDEIKATHEERMAVALAQQRVKLQKMSKDSLVDLVMKLTNQVGFLQVELAVATNDFSWIEKDFGT